MMLKVDRKRDALIVVDVQNDFCPGGALGVNEGDRIIPIINRLIPWFDHVVSTRDWHPADHLSFTTQPEFIDRSWPPHCVAGTSGARFHPDLQIPDHAVIVSKGTDPEMEAYSGFQGTNLKLELQEWGVTRIFIAGLATDYCVKSTALDALSAGFKTVVLEDAVRGVDVPPGSAVAALDEMRNKRVLILSSFDLST
jgi:nicotinamidase/pyrazinamidase